MKKVGTLTLISIAKQTCKLKIRQIKPQVALRRLLQKEERKQLELSKVKAEILAKIKISKMELVQHPFLSKPRG